MKYNGLIPPDAFPAPMEDASQNTFFVHIHIPKTGGTTFNAVLEKNFQSSFDRFEGRFIHLFPKVTIDQMKKYISLHYSIRAVTSHQFTAILPYRTVSRPIVAVAFLRDPVEQFFSKYFHQRRFGMNCPQRELFLNEYISYCISKNIFINYCTYLVPIAESEGMEYLEDLIIAGNLFLLPLEYHLDAVRLLNRLFPSDFQDISCPMENISPRDQEVTDEMRERVAEHIPMINYKLHEMSLKVFSERNAFVPGGAAVKG